MSHRVFFTSRAKQQLIQSAYWWAEHRSVDQAYRWLDGFEKAINLLQKNPEQHGLARENEIHAWPNRVRQLLYGLGSKPTHRAVFEIRSDVVYVLAVRHLAQDDLKAEDLK